MIAQNLKESEVPESVKTAFARNFPAAKSVKWSKEKDGEFEAEFKRGKQEQSSNYDASGKWLVTEKEISKKDLPVAIHDALKKEFSGFEIEEVETVEAPDVPMTYEIALEKGETNVSVVLSKDGTVLKKVEGIEDGEDKDK